ncbi:MAG TPA: hypothetical protein VIO61_11005 [Anaerolineaceae bacterium]
MKQKSADDLSRDLSAYIAIALLEINQTVDVSVTAWEKRGYWVKADRFRLDWEWSGILGEKMRKAVLGEDWGTVAVISAQVAQKLMKIDVPTRNRIGTPWIGAWKELVQNMK